MGRRFRYANSRGLYPQIKNHQLSWWIFILCSKTGACYERQYNSFFNKHNNKDTAPVFAFRLCRCSTVKSRSKREKLSLKTLIIPRVRLAIEFGSFFIYATILSIFVDFWDCDFNSHLRLLFSVLLRLCRKANKKRR